MDLGTNDFERLWLEKFAGAIDALADEETRRAVMEGGGSPDAKSESGQTVAWTRAAMERLLGRLGEARARDVLTRCACRYPEAELRIIRREFEAAGEIDAAMRMLQDRFESFLRGTLHLDEERIAEVVRRGWGPAGVRQGDTIIATKIPKSGCLAAYLEEKDAGKRRAVYCHCPRVRSAVARGEEIPEVYCYCGAGYYKGIWESILHTPVRVELLDSVLQGGDVCRVAIRIPIGKGASNA
jgi:hypothetical protein